MASQNEIRNALLRASNALSQAMQEFRIAHDLADKLPDGHRFAAEIDLYSLPTIEALKTDLGQSGSVASLIQTVNEELDG